MEMKIIALLFFINLITNSIVESIKENGKVTFNNKEITKTVGISNVESGSEENYEKITPDSLFNNTSIHPHLKRSLDDDYTPSSVNPLPGKSKVITTRFGADGVKPEQQCQCVLNHMCNAEHVVTLGESLPDDQRCPSGTVCCLCMQSLSSPLPPVNDGGLCIDSDPINNVQTTSTLQISIDNGVTTAAETVSEDPITPTAQSVPEDPTSPTAQPVPEGPTSGSTSQSTSQCNCVQRNECDPSFTWIDVRVNDQSSICPLAETVCCPWNYILNITTTTTTTTTTSTTTNTVTEYQCGRRTISTQSHQLNSKTSAEFGEFPWMARIYKVEVSPDGKQTESFVCGGSLLSSTVVLTAAHCVKNMNNNTKIRVGEHILGNAGTKPYQDRSIVAIIQNKQFDSVHFHNDFALLVVSEPFQLDSHVTPICIPTVNSEFELEKIKLDTSQCVVTGWGKTVFDPEPNYSKTLKKVILPIVDRESCEKQLRETRLGSNFTLHSSLLCAGGKPGVDACKGDGGGPLVCPLVEDPTRFVQVGVTAAGLRCGTSVPGLYANLLDKESLNWITTQYVLSTPSLRSKLQ